MPLWMLHYFNFYNMFVVFCTILVWILAAVVILRLVDWKHCSQFNFIPHDPNNYVLPINHAQAFCSHSQAAGALVTYEFLPQYHGNSCHNSISWGADGKSFHRPTNSTWVICTMVKLLLWTLPTKHLSFIRAFHDLETFSRMLSQQLWHWTLMQISLIFKSVPLQWCSSIQSLPSGCLSSNWWMESSHTLDWKEAEVMCGNTSCSEKAQGEKLKWRWILNLDANQPLCYDVPL